MFEFIEQHKRIVLIAMGVIVLALVIVLYFAGRNTSQETTNSNTANNNLDYSYLKKYPSAADQNLLLTAHIAGEEYGTYSKSDQSSLNDLLNQSTSNFQPKVQALINQALASSTEVTTIVDPNSLQLDKTNDSSAVVSMDAKSTITGGAVQNIKLTVQLVRQNNHWLIDNINVENQ